MAGLAQFLVGHVLDDHYRLESVLGEGGFGVVFRAADLRTQRNVAVKVLDAPRGMNAVQVERLRHRFQREAEVAARLPLHPNLVPVLDYGATERLDYLVMELLLGESLRERLARQDDPVPLRTALRILRDSYLAIGDFDAVDAFGGFEVIPTTFLIDRQGVIRHRKTGEPHTLNFAFENKLQRKFSPLYLKRVTTAWRDTTVRQLPAYVAPCWTDACRKIEATNVADFCLEMYRAMGLLEGVEVVRSSSPDVRRAAEYTVESSAGPLRARAVILALPAYGAAHLLRVRVFRVFRETRFTQRRRFRKRARLLQNGGSLPPVLHGPLRSLVECPAAEGVFGTLSLGFELDFAADKVKSIQSGKSTSLLQAAFNYEERGQQVLLAKPDAPA